MNLISFNSIKIRVCITYLMLVYLIFNVGSVYAQNVNLNLYSAYVFDDSFNSSYDNNSDYNGKIKGGYQWGLGLEYMMQPEVGIELLYLRQDTKAPTQYQGDGIFLQNTDFDLGINYILVGGSGHAIAPSKKIEAFGGLMAGMVVVSMNNPDNGNTSTAEKFAWGGKAGGILWPNERIGIKLQAQLLSAVQSIGGGFFFGTGGASAGLAAYSTIYQFSLGGGLVIRLGQ